MTTAPPAPANPITTSELDVLLASWRCPIRYQACHPGALVHQDHKKLGRVPDGGGHQIRGLAPGYRKSGLGYDHFEVVVDDRSRVAFVVQVADERPAGAARALELPAVEFARLGSGSSGS